MGMEFLAFLASGGVMESLCNKIEHLKNLLTFIGELPEWLNYHDRFVENVQTLKRKMEALGCLEEDVNEQLEIEESRSRKKRKREVENWLRNVQTKKNEVQRIDQEVRETKIFLRPLLGSRIEKNIREVDELRQEGSFSEGLLLEAPQTKGEALLITQMVNNVTSKRNLENIWACLTDDEIVRIGVFGKEGVGKTLILSHIYNRLLENTGTFDHVYLVTVSQFSIHNLQNDIAKEVGLDPLDETDEMKRAAKLSNALQRRKKSVLILDDLRIHFPLEKVGIPTQVNGCKLILATQSSGVCRKMGCQKTVEVEPLPVEEAEKLFKVNLGLNNRTLDPEMEENVKLIVKKCDGLRRPICKMAERLRAVDDINEWRNALTEVRESKMDQ
ncbi:hypothetical protein F0562_010271 [Nyssa sinensis]|uniref:NB-ARC domain-containing protein n=1 Tax=Nyssa sinensis TaxID=561372 RepID=A0A5J5A1I6_9ASTE|nr:hypothetical protein F0562_010271 [Nyssa sinensis]